MLTYAQMQRRHRRYEQVAYIAAAIFMLGGVFVVAVVLTVLMMELAHLA